MANYCTVLQFFNNCHGTKHHVQFAGNTTPIARRGGDKECRNTTALPIPEDTVTYVLTRGSNQVDTLDFVVIAASDLAPANGQERMILQVEANNFDGEKLLEFTGVGRPLVLLP